MDRKTVYDDDHTSNELIVATIRFVTVAYVPGSRILTRIEIDATE